MKGSETTAEHLTSWGCIGHLTELQEEELTQFKRKASTRDLDIAKFRVESYDSVSLRFLRARDFSVPKALLLLSECVKRKEAANVEQYSSLTADEAAHCDVEALKKWYPHSQLGYDKLNRPILFEHSGKVSSTGLLQMTTLENLLKYHWWTMENELNRMFDQAATRGPVNISTCVILDFSGMTLSHFAPAPLEQLKAIVAIDNTCYPELLGKMIVINAPWIAISMWDALKGWLDPRTQTKIEIMKAGVDSDRKLLEFIDPDNLPKAYGGTGPESYYCKPNSDLLHIPRGGHIAKSITLQPQALLQVDSYLGEGEVTVEVTKQMLTGGPTTVLKKVHVKHSDCHPHRLLLDFVNDQPQPMLFTVTWTNAARFYTRPLTYVFTVTDTSVSKGVPIEEAVGGLRNAAPLTCSSENEGEVSKADSSSVGAEPVTIAREDEVLPAEIVS